MMRLVIIFVVKDISIEESLRRIAYLEAGFIIRLARLQYKRNIHLQEV